MVDRNQDVIHEISEAIHNERPVSFIIGAGASISGGIPSATALINEAKKKYSSLLKELDEDQLKNYGVVMQTLAPKDRKDLIQPHLDNSVINWGHFALAGIFCKPNVKRILTFNFDFLLERAAMLYGEHYPVYDFGIAPTSELNLLAEKAIIHLHGQSYGLRLLNSDGETDSQAPLIAPLINKTVNETITVVIGYSGGSDGAFAKLCDEYSGYNRLYWLGHNDEPDERLKKLLEQKYVKYVGGCDFDQTMIQIAQDLEIWPPKILDNPPEFVLEQIQKLPDYPVYDSQFDVNKHLEKRLGNLKTSWEAQEEKDQTTKRYNAFLKGDYEEASKDVSPNADENEKELVYWSLIKQGNSVLRLAGTLDLDEKLAKYQEAQEFYEKASELNPRESAAFNNWANALSDEAMCLEVEERLNKLQEATGKYEAAFKIKPDDYDVLNNWGNAIYREAMSLEGEERLKKLQEAGEKYNAALKIKPDHISALNNWGGALLYQSILLIGKEREDALSSAKEKLMKAKEISGEPSYNLACYYALQGQTNEALDELEACKAFGNLPSIDHVRQDETFKSLHGNPRFEALFN